MGMPCKTSKKREDPEQHMISRVKITSLEGIQYLTNLTGLNFSYNTASDIQPLINNTGLGDGDEVWMIYNNLNLTPGSQNMTDIKALLESKGLGT